jgi:hypothetical protein
MENGRVSPEDKGSLTARPGIEWGQVAKSAGSLQRSEQAYARESREARREPKGA